MAIRFTFHFRFNGLSLLLIVDVVLVLWYLKIVPFFVYFTITDINECDAKELNNCTSHQYCVNELGSYHCSCVEGFHSDGEACVPDKSSLTIKLTVGKYIYLKVMIITYSSLHTHYIYNAMWNKIMFQNMILVKIIKSCFLWNIVFK